MAVIQDAKKHRTIQDLVARHPMVTFTIVAYAITWLAWPLNNRTEFGVTNGFGIIGLAGPALAGILVSASLRPEPSGVPAGKRWRLFGLIGFLVLASMTGLRLWNAAGLITAQGRGAATVAYPSPFAFLTDVLAALLVAFIFSSVLSPRRGVRDLLRSLDLRSQPVRWYWWAFAVGFYPATFALGLAVSTAIGLPASAPSVAGPWYWLVLDALILFVYGLFGGGGLEEPGWRGFALPTLQKKYTPFLSSAILGVIWAFWHWPMLQAGAVDKILHLMLEIFPLAFLFTAVFNRTGGSLPVVILLHTSINITEMILPASTPAAIFLKILYLVLALWMWRSPLTFSPRSVGNT